MTNSALTRRVQLTVLLAAAGALIGAITAALLSILATAIAQTLTPTGRVGYFYEPLQFAIAGAIGTPVLTWWLMRRVPLWRAVAEPALGGVLGTLLALVTVPLFHAPIVQALCVPLGILGAAVRLRRVHRRETVGQVGPAAGKVPHVAS